MSRGGQNKGANILICKNLILLLIYNTQIPSPTPKKHPSMVNSSRDYLQKYWVKKNKEKLINYEKNTFTNTSKNMS